MSSALSCRAADQGYRVVKVYPHDPGAFTQGLVFHQGALYEGTGMVGQSSLRKVDLETGKVLQRVELPAPYFGEGIALAGNRVVQLTWQHHVGFVWDLASFKMLSKFNYPGEGWGLTTGGKDLYMSDGTAVIRVLDPDTLAEKRRIRVAEPGGMPVMQLNELEWVRGEIYANVWQTERLVRVSPVDGRVLGWVNLAGLMSPAERARTDVLNGVAYDPAGDRLFVTGKWWPKLFEIKLTPVK